MTSTEFIVRLDKLESEIARLNLVAFIPIVNKVQGELTHRIFNLGQAIDGSKIGKYSTTQPEYADVDAFVVKSAFKPEKRKRAVNKGKSPGSKGTLRTTIDLASGYSELREIQGFQNEYVDLSYSGSLMTSIYTGVLNGKVVISFGAATETKKGRGNEKRFGKSIFALSIKERDILRKEVLFFISEMVKKILLEK